MKLRSQIDEKFKWDLSKYCESDKQWYEKLEELKKFPAKFSAFWGKLNTEKNLWNFLELEKEYYYISSALNMYASHNLSVDLSNSKFIEMDNLLTAIDTQVSVSASFFAPEMLSYDESYLKQIIQNKKFKDYAFSFNNLLRNKEHILSEKEEKILSLTGNFAGEFSKVYQTLVDVNLKFSKVKNKSGKLVPLNSSNFISHLSGTDRTLRKNAFVEYYNVFNSFSDTIATNFIASVKSDWFYSQTAKFTSTLNSMLYPDNIKQDVYDKLIKNVNENLTHLHEYYKVKKQILKLKDFSYHDLYVPATNLKKKYTFEQSMNILYEALKPLGEDYIDLLKQSVTERWIDVFPNKNKVSGAYQSGSYGTTPIVLLNFKGLTDDVFTIAHELGHAMHTYFSNKNQPLPLSSYTIFLAEVASTVNEVLLLKHFYNNAQTKQEKIYYLEHYLQMFKGTLFRQTMFSEFEQYVHKLVETNSPISKNVLNNFYEQINKKYQGKNVLHNKLINYEWLRIPHFYNSFYVFKYATGITSAICIASNIYNGSENALNNYKKFLSAGGSNFSVETLKIAGVDLETNKPYDIAFSEMKWAIEELKKLIN